MKKIILITVATLFSYATFAQSSFDKLENNDEISSVVVSKKMFELMSKVKVNASDKEEQHFINLIQKLESLKVFTTEKDKWRAEMKAMVANYLKTKTFEELMRINDKGSNVKIYVRQSGKSNIINELLMYVESSEKTKQTVIMSLTGEFNLDDVSALTEKMNLPGGEEIKKATKK